MLTDDRTSVTTELSLEVPPVVENAEMVHEPAADDTGYEETPVTEEKVIAAARLVAVVAKPAPTERPARGQGETDEVFAERIRDFYRERWASVRFEDITQEEAAYIERLGGEKETSLFESAEDMSAYREEVNPFLKRKSGKGKAFLASLVTLVACAGVYFATRYCIVLLIAKNIAAVGG